MCAPSSKCCMGHNSSSLVCTRTLRACLHWRLFHQCSYSDASHNDASHFYNGIASLHTGGGFTIADTSEQNTSSTDTPWGKRQSFRSSFGSHMPQPMSPRLNASEELSNMSLRQEHSTQLPFNKPFWFQTMAQPYFLTQELGYPWAKNIKKHNPQQKPPYHAFSSYWNVRWRK